MGAQLNLDRAVLGHSMDLHVFLDGHWKEHPNDYTMAILKRYFHLWTVNLQGQCGISRK